MFNNKIKKLFKSFDPSYYQRKWSGGHYFHFFDQKSKANVESFLAQQGLRHYKTVGEVEWWHNNFGKKVGITGADKGRIVLILASW